MITIDLAKTQHHFIDADEAQDRIASSLAQSVQYTGKNLLISSVTLCVILFVSAGLIGYQLRSGVNPVYLIVAAVLLFLYMPRCLKVWQEYRDSSVRPYVPGRIRSPGTSIPCGSAAAMNRSWMTSWSPKRSMTPSRSRTG